jgi:hypothetical protein
MSTRGIVSALLVSASLASAADPGTKKTASGWSFTSEFEKPVVKQESYAMLPIEFSIAFYVGDQDQRHYGLTRAHSHLGRQSLFIDLGNNNGPAGFGATGVIKEFPIEKLLEGTRFAVEGWMCSDPDHPLKGGRVDLRLEFYGPTSQTLIYKTEDDASLQHARIDSGNATTTFNRYFFEYVVGPDTIPNPAVVRLVKLVVGGNTDGNSGKGRVLVDNVSLTVTVPEKQP